MRAMQPLVIYRYHDGGFSPNPWKVVIFLYELGLPWIMKTFDRAQPDVRETEPLRSLTPNGRMPVLEDPNTGIVVWESGAIIEYLLAQYDEEKNLQYRSLVERYEQKSWMHFQMSGQGPYYGQRAWFLHLHSESLPSAQERYAVEIKRILRVIDRHLARTGRQWLVGQRMSFVDLMFVPWNVLLTKFMMPEEFIREWQRDYPQCWAWHNRLLHVPSVRKAEEFVQGNIDSNPTATIQVRSVQEIIQG